MNKKILSIVTLLFFATAVAFAQEQVISSNRTNNNALLNAAEYNPAKTGLDNKLNAFVNYRKQWVGFDGAPEVLYGSVQGKFMGNMGAGISFSSSQSSIFKTFTTSLNYSYTLKMSDKIFFSPGFGLGIKKNSIDKASIDPNLIDDPAYSSDIYSKTSLTTAFGVNARIHDLSVEFALPEMYATDTKEFGQNMLAFVAYDFYTPNDIFRLQPSVLYRKSVYSDNLIDVNFMVDYKNLIWIQAGYRNNTDFTFGIGVNYKMFGVAYGYDMINSGLGIVSKGSHEIGLHVFLP